MNSPSSLNDARLDRAIDRAVREMMHVDPEPGLRRRVLSRINAPVERRTLPFVRYGFAAAMVAVVVAAVSISLQPGQIELPAPPKAPAPIVAGGVPPVVLPLVPPTVIKGPGTPNETAPPITRDVIRMPPVTNVFGERRSKVAAATVREPDFERRISPEILTPLTIVPLSARPIVIDRLVVMALPK